ALDVMRAITGRVPDHRVLAAEAAEEGGASLAWPAPRDPDRAIDDLEHDLSALKPLLDTRASADVRGRAHYLLGLNDALRRSVISRWMRDQKRWSPSDGLIRVAPAIERVWLDEIGELRRDLGIWVQKLADDQIWRPAYFEFSFGLNDEGRDPRSVPEPIVVDGRFVLRGSVDLVEHRADLDVLRVTDHKTGKNRSTPDLIVGGGAMLQPVLYSVAVEEALGKKVVEGRLYYATTVGGFVDKAIPINDYTRSQGLQVLEIVDRAVETGFLAAAPGDRACTWCDFRPVCGPREEERVGRKHRDHLADLDALRSMR